MQEINKINIGIVGFGKMGILHAGTINALSGCAVSAITEREGLLLRFAKKVLPRQRIYSDVKAMLLEENLDGIVVSTPISSHARIVREIIASGRRPAILVEKPLARNYEEAKEITDATAALKIRTMVGFQKRFSPIFQKAKRILNDGYLGELRGFEAHVYVSSPHSRGKGWRMRPGYGGALLDLGPHLLDLLLWYFGEPRQVSGQVKSISSKNVDDFVSGTLELRSGVSGSFEISWCAEGYRLPENSIRVRGQNGILHVTDDFLRFELYSECLGTKAGKYIFKKPEFNLGVEYLIGDPEYCMEDTHFIDCIRNGKFPEPSFQDGLRVNCLIEQIQRPRTA